MKFRMAMTLLSILPCGPALAQQFQDHGIIDAAVVAATGAAAGQNGGAIGPVDRRLKLANCPVALQADPPAMGAIAIRCPSLGWRIRIPLLATQATSRVAESTQIIVKRGENVELRAVGPGFEINSTAIALEDGALGKGIRVKSLTNNTALVATVSGPSSVQISH